MLVGYSFQVCGKLSRKPQRDYGGRQPEVGKPTTSAGDQSKRSTVSWNTLEVPASASDLNLGDVRCDLGIHSPCSPAYRPGGYDPQQRAPNYPVSLPVAESLTFA
jgi:hypothetical protein